MNQLQENIAGELTILCQSFCQLAAVPVGVAALGCDQYFLSRDAGPFSSMLSFCNESAAGEYCWRILSI